MDIREPLIGVVFEPRDLPSSSAPPIMNGNSTLAMHESRRALLSPSTSAINESLMAVVWGANWVARIDLEQLKNGDKPSSGNGNTIKVVRREADKKRAREEERGFVPSTTSSDVSVSAKVDITVTRRYQPLVLLDFVGNGELVAVEKTWFDLAKGLPEAWIRSGEFGT